MTRGAEEETLWDWTFNDVPDEYLFDRGYTGHEHLERFDLINMNGRVYDPRVCRFLSPDPFVQSPGYSQSYNRYAYAFNNPLKYVDLSGYSNKPPVDFAGRGGNFGFTGSPFTVLSRGEINYWGISQLNVSGFTRALRETESYVSGVDDDGKPIYSYRQVLVLQDRYGNNIDRVDFEGYYRYQGQMLGYIHYLVSNDGNIKLIGYSLANGSRYFATTLVNDERHLVSLILIDDSSYDEWFNEYPNRIEYGLGKSSSTRKYKFDNQSAIYYLKTREKNWNNISARLADVGICVSVGVAINYYNVYKAITLATGFNNAVSSYLLSKYSGRVQRDFLNVYLSYLSLPDDQKTGIYVIEEHSTYHRRQEVLRTNNISIYLTNGLLLGTINY